MVRAANPAEPTPPKTPELSPETRRLFESAVTIASERHDQNVGSEHLLLALVKGDDKSIRYLIRQIKLEPSVVRSCVERVLQQGRDDLPPTQPFVQDEAASIPGTGPLQAQSDPDMRTKVLQMVTEGKITAAEAAELLKAMRFAAIPTPGKLGYVLLPADSVNFDNLRQRTLRVVVTNTRSKAVKAEVTLPFERLQAELFRVLSEVYSGSTGSLAEWSDDQNHIEISMD